MRLPIADQAREEVRLAIRGLRANPHWKVVKAWFASELAERDRENREIGHENKLSEAQCLADMLEQIAACEASDADSENTVDRSDAESMSA